MDVLPRITRQLIELFRAMSPVQRVTVAALTVGLTIAFGWLMFVKPTTDFQPLSYGKLFAADELASAEQALIASGLSSFRRDGQRLLAPRNEIDRYNAALLESDTMPTDLGAQMLKQFESMGPFSTDRQRQQMKEALLLQELRRMIRAVPDIHDARVVIASSDRRAGWNQKLRTTANVMVKPKTGREISALLVSSLRHVVANMVPDLKPADVTIFDVSRGQAFTGDPAEDPFDNRVLQHTKALTSRYEQQIQKALAHIPHVSVTAHVDMDALRSAMVHSETVRSRTDVQRTANRVTESDDPDPHQTAFRGPGDVPTETTREVTDKQIVAAMPKAVQVSVSIPRDYIRDVAIRLEAKGEKSPERLNPDFIEEEVISKVEQIVGRLIPADSPSGAVSVTCVDRLATDSTELPLPAVSEQILDVTRRWQGAIIAGVAILIGIAVVRSFAASPAVAEASASVAPVEDSTDEQPTEAENSTVSAVDQALPDQGVPLREEIRDLVATDVTATASLIGRSLVDTNLPDANRRAVILILSLDQLLAAEVLAKLPREHVERITLAIASLDHVTRDEQEAVLSRFKTDFTSRPMMQPAGPDTARELLERALDRDDVEPIQQRIDNQIHMGPFSFLNHRHPDEILRLVDEEHPQTIAVICAQLPPNLAAQVLAGFEADRQADVLSRVAKLGATDPELLTEIASLLEDRLGRNPLRQGGVNRAAELLRESNRSTSRTVLSSLHRQDAKLAQSLRESLFAFNDLQSLDDQTLDLVLQMTDGFSWAVALKGCSEALRQRIFRRLPAKVAQGLKDELSSIGPIRLSEIIAVQRQIAEAVLKLDTENQIELPNVNRRS